jgi:hypothetical protein
MAKLVSMKMSKKEREGESYPTKVDAPAYPWGLQLNLGNEEIEKLGSGNVPMDVGEEITIIAKAKVTSASMNASEGGKQRHSVTLQITDLCLEEEADAGAVAKSLYDGAHAEK